MTGQLAFFFPAKFLHLLLFTLCSTSSRQMTLNWFKTCRKNLKSFKHELHFYWFNVQIVFSIYLQIVCFYLN